MTQPTSAAPYVIGTDTGGTFTDCVLMNIETGESAIAKASSTPDAYEKGVVESARRASQAMGLELSEVLPSCQAFCHGTTVATNTLITRSGAKVGFITTTGHEDVLFIARLRRKSAGMSVAEARQTWDLINQPSLIDRDMVRGIPGRLDYAGKEFVGFDEAATREAIESLVEAGAEVLAVGLLWAHVNPDHEERVAALVAEIAPDLLCITSHETSKAMGEYERFAATVTSAYLAPRVSTYLSDLRDGLRSEGFGGEFLVMQSSGGVTTMEKVARRGVALANSGPAGGVVAARALAKEEDMPNLIAVDAGGTSYDVSVIIDGEAESIDMAVVATYHVRVPMLDVRSVGAGGGSIAHIGAGGRALAVGPRSAGSMPGPVAFSRGGTEPTVTDADLVLGRMGVDNPIGGEITPDLAAAETAMDALGKELGLSTVEVALGICQVATANKADLIRRRTIARGLDARDFALTAFGGLGPTHAVDIAEEIGISRVVVPLSAGVFSASGIARSDFWHSTTRSVKIAPPFDPAEINELLNALRAELREEFDDPGELDLRPSVDLRYLGQVHDVRVELPDRDLEAADTERIMGEFERLYEAYFGTGTLLASWPAEIVTVRVNGRVQRKLVEESTAKALPRETTDSAVRRPVFFDASGPTESAVHWREDLTPGSHLVGPAVVESNDTTFILNPGWEATVTENRNIIAQQTTERAAQKKEEVAYA